jgi:membrane protein implicated in regulation of membrane protease activity
LCRRQARVYAPGVGILYLVALILGLGTIGLQFVLSHVSADLDHDHDFSGGHDVSPEHGDADGALSGAAALFLSMRFWTFALMAFGLVGSALHYLELCNWIVCLVLASGSGLGSGLLAAWVFKNLTKGVTSSESNTDAVGQVARVLVPVSKEHPGKVRIKLKGKVVDMVATTDAEVLEGDEVLVVEMRDTSAHVEAAPTKSSDS